MVSKTMRVSMLASVAVLALGMAAPVQAQQNAMTFFVTSEGPGKGGDLGGLAGADAHCAKLAAAAGSTDAAEQARMAAVFGDDRVASATFSTCAINSR